MLKISFVKSLMEFQKRVLYQGTLDKNSSYTMKELKSLIFFNKIFISNTMEMFQKYNMSEVISDYIECIGIYVNNISMIIRNIISKSNIMISNKTSFERRLFIEKELSDQVIVKFYPSIDLINFKFINGGLYYISILDNGIIAISFVDPRRSVYNITLKQQNDEKIIYWKSDDCIKEYIHLKYNTIDTIAVKVTVSEKNIVTKVEYNGDTKFMKNILDIFNDETLVISNPFIYIDDIERIIDENNDSTPIKAEAEFKQFSFAKILKHDKLIEYPKESFDEYLSFLYQAAQNKYTKSIYITLYRIGDDPSIFYILKNAVDNGIRVMVNIEMYASGEIINRMWLREMEQIGIHVTTYAAGILKVHCKLTLIEFTNGLRISQIGTGNYHTKTTTQYTDLSLITADADICNQVKNVFRILDGNEDVKFNNNNLLITRYNARNELIKLIDLEGSKGSNGNIIIKCNALDDDDIIYHIDNAAKRKCNIILIIRGVCTWVPSEDSENVKIKSIVWDKLEHSRVYSFGIENPIMYLGSLDLVTKKIDKRIETLVRINDPNIRIQICEYLNRYSVSTQGSWLQTSSGMYIKEE